MASFLQAFTSLMTSTTQTTQTSTSSSTTPTDDPHISHVDGKVKIVFPKVKLDERYRTDRANGRMRTMTLNEICEQQKFNITKPNTVHPAPDVDFESQIHHRGNSALLSSMFEAYCSHFGVEIRPDDIWEAILGSFNLYWNIHAEELRHLVVNHKGQKDIVVTDGECGSDTGYYGLLNSVVPKICEKIAADNKINLVDWIKPTFSTTTENDIRFCMVTAMSLVKAYYKYSFVLCCGFSSVTLCGTKEDWVMLREKVLQMKTLFADNGKTIPTIDHWSDVMIHVLNSFIAVFDGVLDESFWQSPFTTKSYGSGGDIKFQGWILAFFPFNTKGEYRLKSLDQIVATKIYGSVLPDEIPSCRNICSIHINDNGNHYDVDIVADATSYTVDDLGNDEFCARTTPFVAIGKNEAPVKEGEGFFDGDE
jgi:hypothetical protein